MRKFKNILYHLISVGLNYMLAGCCGYDNYTLTTNPQ